VKVLDLIRKGRKKSNAEVNKVSGKNQSSVCKIVKITEICASFVVISQIAKVTDKTWVSVFS
jgi:hypothetical protein